MKTYRVVLVTIGTVFVEAESAVKNERTLSFIRNEHVCAEYALAMVKSFEETTAERPLADKEKRHHSPPEPRAGGLFYA